MMIRFPGSLLLALVFLTVASDSAIASDTKAAAPIKPAVPAAEPYAPGLGDFMTAYVQPHHIKLWLAGNVGNWRLAAYEADELTETFEDITTYQATWKNVPVAQLVKAMIEPAMKSVDAAIASKNAMAFKNAYTSLTVACNACHTAAQHDFLQINIPGTNPFPNQEFSGHSLR
jgi:hypothetical protein